MWPLTSWSPSWPIQITLTCGLPSALIVLRWASGPALISSVSSAGRVVMPTTLPGMAPIRPARSGQHGQASPVRPARSSQLEQEAGQLVGHRDHAVVAGGQLPDLGWGAVGLDRRDGPVDDSYGTPAQVWE